MQMPDPMVTLAEFQKAYRRGIDSIPCELHPNIILHVDRPEGTPRLTYAKVEHGRVKALAVFVVTDPIDGEQCYHVGYAVPEAYRGRGWASEILQQGIDELRNGLRRNGVKRFYVEAIVSQDNLPSQHVAAKVISASPKSGTDGNTGEPTFEYTRLVECA